MPGKVLNRINMDFPDSGFSDKEQNLQELSGEITENCRIAASRR